jgi:hypothetical protein
MINILIYDLGDLNSVSWWRLYRPLMVMRGLYPGRFNIKTTRKPLPDDVWYTDVFILSRPNDAEALTFIEFVRGVRPDAKFILDIDDAITNVPVNHHQYAHHNARKTTAYKIWEMVDYFWVSTEQLLYECDCMGRGEVIPNAVLPEDLPKEPAPDRGLWMWRGNGLQYEDVYKAGYDTYEEIKYKAKKWVFWGSLPSLNHGPNVELWENEKQVNVYFAKLKAAQFNGVWKPLVDNQFNDAKSNIAWIEATMSGGVCLTNYAGKSPAGQWAWAMDRFPKDYDEACFYWAHSRDAILNHYNLETTARQRAESLERVLNNQPMTA